MNKQLLRQRAAAVRRRHVRFQEARHSLISVDLILHARKSVTFVLVDFVLDHSATLLNRIHDLLSFFFRAARIVPTRQQATAAL